MPNRWRYFLAGFVLVAILVSAVVFLRLRHNQAKLPTVEDDFVRAKGPVDAPVQMIEYSDFECPACQLAQATLRELMTQYPAKIRLIYQHFPLSGHKFSPLAHRAAECAAHEKKFWEYHDRLYAEQSHWSASAEPPIEAFLSYARDAGLNVETFARCLADASVDQKIQQERLAGEDLGVRSTPTFFVNGRMVAGILNLAEEVRKSIKS